MPFDKDLEPGAYRDTEKWKEIFEDLKRCKRGSRRSLGESTELNGMDIRRLAYIADSVFMDREVPDQGPGEHEINVLIAEHSEIGGRFSFLHKIQEDVSLSENNTGV